jgi:2-dehydropantoate 2-reductase
MRFLILGAGAIGGAIGGRLHESGHDVVLLARGRHLAALRESGLELTTPQGHQVLSIPAIGGPDEIELSADDVLVVAVKSQDTAGILATWAGRPVAGGGTAGERLPLVCAQNGVANEAMALRFFAAVYGLCLWLPATHLEPGRVAVPGAPLSGILHLGRYPAGTDPTVRTIAEALDRSRFQAPVVEDVMRWKYGKLIGNLANSLDALAGPIDDGPALEVRRRVAAEGERVLAAAGIAFTSRREQAERRGRLIETVQLDGVTLGGSSSRQSLTRGTGSIEADYLNGEIVLLARMYGVAAPLNEALQRLADQWAGEGRPAGSLPADQLAELLTL